MDSFVTALTLKALDGLHARSVVTADNIANVSTQGYRPRRVTFEGALAAAAAQGRDGVAVVKPAVILDAAAGPEEPQVRLDLELATSSSTALRYSALIETLNRELELQSLAIKGGR